jgi:hypothetical protein
LPGNVSSVVLPTSLVLFVARKECCHALDSFVTELFTIGKTCGPGHSASNALLARFLRRQATFAILLA